MTQNLVSIDDVYYNIKIPENGITRSFSVVDTDNSGRNISGDMLRDIIGTYYNYTILFETKDMDSDEYDQLYETLSAPVDYHMITVPYGQETLTFKAYVTSGNDSIKQVTRMGKKVWTGLSINFVAMSPQRK